MDEVFGFLGRVALGGFAMYIIFHLGVGAGFFLFGDDGFTWAGLGYAIVFLIGLALAVVMAYLIGNFLVSI